MAAPGFIRICTQHLTHVRQASYHAFCISLLDVCLPAGSTLNVSRLIAAGCGVDLTTNDGWTALHEAAANGHLAVVHILLDANSQVHPGKVHNAKSLAAVLE